MRLEPAERAAYLTRACEADTEMREEVESLLEAHEATGEFLETPVLQEPGDPVLGARLGAYEVVELIGNGGMGSVYRGVRVDEAFHKEVAIKVVQRGLDLDRVVRQFRRERQIVRQPGTSQHRDPDRRRHHGRRAAVLRDGVHSRQADSMSTATRWG